MCFFLVQAKATVYIQCKFFVIRVLRYTVWHCGLPSWDEPREVFHSRVSGGGGHVGGVFWSREGIKR